MIDQRDTSWDDTGFEDDDSFRRAKQEPTSASTPSVPPAEDQQELASPSTSTQSDLPAESPTPKPRQQPIVIPPPTSFRPSDTETAKDRRRRRLSTAVIALALLTIIIAGGYIISTLFLPDETETALFIDTEDNRNDTIPRQSVPVPERSDSVKGTIDTPTQSTPAEEPSRPRPTATQPPKEPTTSRAEWVVQVFSSPSRDDAAEWLQTLQRKSVEDGYIVEHDVRGTTWYRVRFGQFATREEAESAAMEAGVQQPWIARIR